MAKIGKNDLQEIENQINVIEKRKLAWLKFRPFAINCLNELRNAYDAETCLLNNALEIDESDKESLTLKINIKNSLPENYYKGVFTIKFEKNKLFNVFVNYDGFIVSLEPNPILDYKSRHSFYSDRFSSRDFIYRIIGIISSVTSYYLDSIERNNLENEPSTKVYY